MSITIAQWTIPVAMIAFFTALFISDWCHKYMPQPTAQLIERSVWAYIIIWKISYVLFSLHDFLQAPISLLYFNGGIKGHILALLIIMLLFYRQRAAIDWQYASMYWLQFVAVYHIVTMLLQQQWLLAIVACLLFGVTTVKRYEWVWVIQFAYIAYITHFTGGILLAHSMFLIMYTLMQKRVQLLALAGIFSLVMLMLDDVDVQRIATERSPIVLPTTTGDMYDVSITNKRLTVVNFFATWCPPCKAEMPHLQSFAQHLPDDVAVIGVNLTKRDDGKDALATFLHTYNVTYPILLDEQDRIGAAYEVISIPTTVILNAQGEEVERIVGPISKERLQQLVDQHVNKLL